MAVRFSRIPHRMRTRKIHDGQFIHQSVLEEINAESVKGYRPKPQCPLKDGWGKIPSDWERIEKDPYSQAGEALAHLSQIEWETEHWASNKHIHVLSSLASYEVGRRSIVSYPTAHDILITSAWLECEAASKQEEPRQMVFDTIMNALAAFGTSPVGVRMYTRRLLKRLENSLAVHFPVDIIREPRVKRLREVMIDLLPQPSLFALTIGINDYSHPEIENLRGAVADADAVTEYLQNSLNVPSSQIVNLRNEDATREGILAAFVSLAHDERIRMGDPILIYYAGLGGKTHNPHSFDSEFIEVLIPQNYSPSVPSIPDRTLGALLNRLAMVKGNNITVIFDIDFFNGTGRGPHSLDFNETQASVVDRNSYDNTLSGDRMPNGVGSHRFLGYHSDNGRVYDEAGRGLFTIALLRVLERVRPEYITYLQLIEQMMAFLPSGQYPRYEGYHPRGTVFGFERPSLLHSVRCEGNVYTLDAGAAHEITMDSEFALYARPEAVSVQPPFMVMTPLEISVLTTTLKPRDISTQVPSFTTAIAVQTASIAEMDR
ncbi:hypothetical protein GALMADRAFT_1129111 [Galerina marginata CBS 339.88]|uniref:Peptidase C14 caspase domain-containing protein n=1 Tax=Galerina marginata (strain CBS 339.88) TaxID=685588 RepID=A0A067SHA4_GALM3|nr:hypothetical protein GALMADRAFT_1129111 [Galerina marginata CBS 339.88]